VTLRILAEPRRVRIEVIDPGTASWGAPPEAQDEDECGCGLLIVDRLADRTGHESVAGGHIRGPRSPGPTPGWTSHPAPESESGACGTRA
jgi:anti-sigma regulatory factor (Ser/Thr protein kinase)